MYWAARRPETLLQRAVYKYHPLFAGSDFKIWWGDSDENFGAASMGAAGAVPEPASGIVALAAAFALAVVSRRATKS
jgi:arginine deiminase